MFIEYIHGPLHLLPLPEQLIELPHQEGVVRDLVHLVEHVELVAQSVLVQLFPKGFYSVQLLHEGRVYGRRILLDQLEGLFRVKLFEE